MVLLVWPPAEHLWIGRNRGQLAPYDVARWPLRRTTLAEDPGSTRPERHVPSGAAQTRVVSAARIPLDPRKSVHSAANDLPRHDLVPPKPSGGVGRHWREAD